MQLLELASLDIPCKTRSSLLLVHLVNYVNWISRTMIFLQEMLKKFPRYSIIIFSFLMSHNHQDDGDKTKRHQNFHTVCNE